MSYIDFHTHIGPLWYGREPLSPTEMLHWMDEHDVEQAVLLPLVSPESCSHYITTETVFEQVAVCPERFIPFCCVDARQSGPMRSAEMFDKMIRQWVDQGAKGFGEIKIGLPVDDERLQAIYGVCNELGLPILFHIDGLRCTDDVQLSGFEAMIQKYPKATFIGHAPGFWAAISGDFSEEQRAATGYPTGPVTPGGAVERLLTTYDNCYADLSAGSAHTAITRDPEYGRGFLERCCQKLLFATDKLMVEQDVPQFQMMADMALPPAAHAAIARGNAERLLGL